MPVKIGFINDVANTSLFNVDDVIRINVNDINDLQSGRSGNGALSGIIHQTKAEIEVEIDRISQTNLGGLREKMFDRTEPHKVFLNHPAIVDTALNPVNGTQTFTYNGITNPSSTHIAKTAASDNPNLLVGTTEISTGDYTTISTFGSQLTNGTPSLKYNYFFFGFDLTKYLADANTTIDSIERITLVLHKLEAVDTISAVINQIGIQVDVFNNSTGVMTEIYRQGLTSDIVNTQFAGLGPVDGFTNFDDYIDAFNKILFRVRNLNEFETVGANGIDIDFVELLINGYGILDPISDNFTFRDAFTGAGKTGTIALNEI